MKRILINRSLALLALTVISACSNNDIDTTITPTVPMSSIGGVAAVGLPISGGNVATACSSFNSSTTTNATGAWALNVPTASLPCATAISGGTLGTGGATNLLTLHSLTVANGSATVSNLTPLTDFALGRAVFMATGADLATWFGNGSSTPAQLGSVASGLPAGRDLLKTVLDNAGYAYPEGGFDPFFASIAPGVAGDIYDEFLEAFAQGIATAAGEGLTPPQAYQAALEAFAEAAEPSVPPAPGDTDPEAPDTTLTTTETGTRFATTGKVLGAQENQRLRYWPGAGTINVGAVAGVLSEVTLTGTEANSYVNFRKLPDRLGTHDCGYGFSEDKANIEVGFAAGSGYNSMGTRGSSGATTPGFRCSITITKIGSRSGSNYTGTIEGHYDAQLYKTGQAVNLPDSISINGHFRAGTPTTTEPEPPVTTSGPGILGTILKEVFAGDYVLKCSSFGQPVQTLAFSIKQDGSSTFKGAALVDATHPGKVETEGVLSSSITLSFTPKAANSDYVVLGFKSDGSFYPNSVYSDGQVLFCYTNSGHSAPTTTAQALARIPGVVGALARTQTLNCTKAGSSQAESLSINSDGSGQAGSQSYTSSQIFKITDSILFGTSKIGEVSYSDTQFNNGQVTSRTLAIGFDQDLATTGVIYAAGLGPNDVSTCSP